MRGFYANACIRPVAVLRSNHRRAAASGLPWLPYVVGAREEHLAIVGGGKTARDALDHIVAWPGPIMAVNGAYDWLADAGRVPEFMVMVDPDEAMAGYVRRPRGGTTFLIGSVCDPGVWRALRKASADVRLWKPQLAEMDTGRKAIPGGPSAMTRAPVLAVMSLGFRQITMFGADCCFEGGPSHAYGGQRDATRRIWVVVNGKVFDTEPPLLQQAEFLADLLPQMRGVDIKVVGRDHLTAALLANGAEWAFAEDPGPIPEDVLESVPSAMRAMAEAAHGNQHV